MPTGEGNLPRHKAAYIGGRGARSLGEEQFDAGFGIGGAGVMQSGFARHVGQINAGSCKNQSFGVFRAAVEASRVQGGPPCMVLGVEVKSSLSHGAQDLGVRGKRGGGVSALGKGMGNRVAVVAGRFPSIQSEFENVGDEVVDVVVRAAHGAACEFEAIKPSARHGPARAFSPSKFSKLSWSWRWDHENWIVTCEVAQKGSNA